MSGHNKWSKIKHVKAKTDAQKSRVFTKFAKLIMVEAKKAGGNMESPNLISAIERAKKENMPNDTIERAIKKATTDNSASMESITYEGYGPAGVAIIIDTLTDNRNRTGQEIKHIFSKHSFAIANPGSASWAFVKNSGVWTPQMTIPLENADIEKLSALVEDFEDNEDVQGVYTNAE